MTEPGKTPLFAGFFGFSPSEGGGEDGIRTHDTLLGYTHLANGRFRPLSHLSVVVSLRGQGVKLTTQRTVASLKSESGLNGHAG